MKNKTIIYAVLAALTFYVWRIYGAVSNLGYSLGALKNFKFTLGVISWDQYINITNGDTVSVPITSADVVNLINGQEIGRTILKGSQTIKPGLNQVLFQVVLGPQALAALGYAAVQGIRTQKISIKFRGTVRSLGFRSPINETFNIDFSKLDK